MVDLAALLWLPPSFPRCSAFRSVLYVFQRGFEPLFTVWSPWLSLHRLFVGLRFAFSGFGTGVPACFARKGGALALTRGFRLAKSFLPLASTGEAMVLLLSGFVDCPSAPEAHVVLRVRLDSWIWPARVRSGAPEAATTTRSGGAGSCDDETKMTLRPPPRWRSCQIDRGAHTGAPVSVSGRLTAPRQLAGFLILLRDHSRKVCVIQW